MLHKNSKIYGEFASRTRHVYGGRSIEKRQDFREMETRKINSGGQTKPEYFNEIGTKNGLSKGNPVGIARIGPDQDWAIRTRTRNNKLTSKKK
jgi:hypothetical protein